MVKIGLICFLAILLSACLVPTDTVVNVKGTVVDGEGVAYSSCEYELVENGNSLFSFRSSGEFQHSDVLGGFNYRRARLDINCDGGQKKTLDLPKLPQSITEYIDFGVVVVERDKEQSDPS